MNAKNTFPVSIWLDCDTGHDDAFALLLAAHHPRSNLLGVSTVHGNAPLAFTTYNTCAVLQSLGRADVLVVQGEENPLARAPSFAKEFHGDTGLDGVTVLPEPSSERLEALPRGMSAVYDRLIAQPPNSVFVVATGPLTNIAKLIAEHPDVSSRICGVSIMGGAIGNKYTNAPMHRTDGPGNWTPFAEFNIFCDPEAAQQIFSNESFAEKITLSTLDLTHQCRVTPDVQEALFGKSPLSPTRLLMQEIMAFFTKSYKKYSAIVDGPPLHDPLAVFAVLFPDQFDDREGERWAIKVDTTENTPGMTSLIPANEQTDGTHPKFRHRVPRGVNLSSLWSTIGLCLDSVESRPGPA